MNAIEQLFADGLIWRLGWTLVHFVWQGALIAVLTAVALWFLRRHAVSSRYVVSCTALLACVAAVMATFALVPAPRRVPEVMRALNMPPLPELSEFGRAVEDPSEARPDPAPALPIVPSALEMPTHPLLPIAPTPAEPAARPAGRIDRLRSLAGWIEPHLTWIVTAWLAGILLLSTRLLYGWVAVQRIRRRFVAPAANHCQRVLADAALRLRVGRPVRLLTSALVQVPVTIGSLRPVILLPVSALTGLSEDQLRAVLAHELAHIRRHDYLVNILQSVVETLLFYHPAVWYLSRRIRIEREHCCDDLAVACCGDRLLYARTLVTMEELRAASSAPSLAAAATGGRLIDRIRRVLGQPSASARFTTPVGGIVAFIGIVMIAVAALRVMTPASAATSPAGEIHQNIRTPMPWIPFSATRLDELTQAGKPVLLHVTAAWCANAKAMSFLIFDTPEIVTAVNEAGFVPVKADWTTYDKEVESLLKRFSRQGVPLTVLIPAGRSHEPIVLPEALTKEQLIRALREAAPTATSPAGESDKDAFRVRHFVRLVAGRDRLTFEGEPVTWDELPARLAAVPDRAQTVLEIAIATSDMTVRQEAEIKSRGWQLAREHGFEYGSYIGQHPLGSKGSPDQSIPPALRSLALEITKLEAEKLRAKTQHDNLLALDSSQVLMTPELQMMIEADPRIGGLKQQLTALKSELETRLQSMGARHRAVRDLQDRIDIYEKMLAAEISRIEREARDYQINAAYMKYLNALRAEVQLRERMAEQDAKQRDLDKAYVRFGELQDRQRRLTAELDHIQEQRRQLESATQPSRDQPASIARVYDVQDLIILMHGENKDSPADKSVEELLAAEGLKLEQLIRRFIAPGTWDKDGTIQHWNDRLIVRHTESVHRQLVEVFGRLRGKDRQGSFEERFQRAAQSLNQIPAMEKDEPSSRLTPDQLRERWQQASMLLRLESREHDPNDFRQRKLREEMSELERQLAELGESPWSAIARLPLPRIAEMTGTWFFDNPQGDAEQMATFEDGRVVVLYSNGHRDETKLVNDTIELAEYGGLKTTLRVLEDGSILQTSDEARGLAKMWKRIDAEPKTQLLQPLTASQPSKSTNDAPYARVEDVARALDESFKSKMTAMGYDAPIGRVVTIIPDRAAASRPATQPTERTLHPGDRLRIRLPDFVAEGSVAEFTPTVDSKGRIDLPQLGHFDVTGLTAAQVAEAIVERAPYALVYPIDAVPTPGVEILTSRPAP